MRRAHRRMRWLAIVALLALSACADQTDTRTPETLATLPAPPAVPETEAAVSAPAAAVPEAAATVPETALEYVAEPAHPEVVFRAPATYLDEIIPPCTPLEGIQHDPCPTGTPQNVAVLSVSMSPPSWPYTDNLPAIEDTIMGYGPNSINHIVVRATAIADTTRCDLYPLTMPDYSDNEYPHTYHYLCFVDVRVNEYIVGTGPAELTAEIHSEVLSSISDTERTDWPNWKDDWLENTVEDPETRTADIFEGKEVVLFLRPSFTIAVEAWGGNSKIADVWFVQRPDEGAVRAVAPDISLAQTEAQRNNLDMPLADLVTKTKAAATARDEAYDGRIGEDSDLPDLVDDANRLRGFYIESGAVYQGDDKTTELPPPVGGPPEPPTNVAVTQDGDRWFITWDAAETGGDAYRYYLWIDSTRSDGTVTSFYNTYTLEAETEFEITNMAAPFGEQFTVQVRAWNSGGYSDWTEIETLTTPPSVTTTTSTTSTSA